MSLKNLDLTDKGRFYVSAISGDTDENAVSATFTVRLSSAPSGDNAATDNVTITMSSSDTGEGTLSVSTGITGDNASQLVFTSANWNAARTVTVTGVADNLSDGDQSYTVVLGADNISTDLRFRYVDPPDVSLKNLDLTGKGSYYVSAASRDTDENGEKSSFTIRLAIAPTDNVTIYVSSSDTSEGLLNQVGDNSTLGDLSLIHI